MDVGTNALEPAQHVEVVIERQLRMKAVDDVDFGQRLMGTLAQLVPRLLERHRVRAGIARSKTGERAEQTACHADVGGLETDVEVVIRPVLMPFLALAIGEPANRQKIRTL